MRILCLGLSSRGGGGLGPNVHTVLPVLRNGKWRQSDVHKELRIDPSTDFFKFWQRYVQSERRYCSRKSRFFFDGGSHELVPQQQTPVMYNLATLQSYIIVSFQQITFSFFVKPLCTAKGKHAKFTKRSREVEYFQRRLKIGDLIVTWTNNIIIQFSLHCKDPAV